MGARFARMTMINRRFLLLNAVLAVPLASASAQVRAEEQRTLMLAAASLKDALSAANAAFARKGGGAITFSFAASSALAKQIESGAPADLFASADEDWMNYLAERKLILDETRRDIAANSLVIASPQPDAGAEDLLTRGKFAMGDPGNVPAGKYAKAALEQMGLWEKAKGNAVFAENVRAALEFVRKGAARAAIVYASDLKAAPELRAAYTFAPETHAPILYPAALVRENETARAFLDFLSSPEGQAIFAEWGFTPAGAVN